MSEDIFDAIIVGAGLAGSVAALVLAREGGASVSYRAWQFRRCQERHRRASLCPQSGTHYSRVSPTPPPVERLITHEKLAFMTEKVSDDYGLLQW